MFSTYLGLIGWTCHTLNAQTSYTYNGVAWSNGSAIVTGPTFDGNSGINITSGSITFAPMYQSSNSSIINSRYSIYQTITPAFTADVKSITIWAETVPSTAYTVVLRLYSGDPLGSNTLLASVSKTTGSLELEFIFPSNVQVTAGGDYFIQVVHQNVNAWRWKLGAVNSFPAEVLYLPFQSDPPQAYALVWDPYAYDYYTGQMGAWVATGNEDDRSLNFKLKYNFFLGDLYLGSGASLTSSNESFVIGGDLTNNGQIILNASNSGYSQLKVGGTITNNGTIIQNQYISSTGHHGISSPMTGGFGTTSGTSSALYAYDAANGAYFSPANTTVTTAGAGYFAPVGTGGYLTAAGTFSVTGTPNTSHTHSLGYATSVAAGGSGNGWNLIGNPYTCGLDWTSVTKTNVNDAFYIWDAATSTYKYYANGAFAPSNYTGTLVSGVIPPMQAFWVQASASGASVVSTMASHGTVASSPTFYKTQPDNIILTVSNLSDAAKGDVLWVKNVYGMTNSFEGQEDAWKMTNYGGYPNIYTYDNGQKMAINATDLMQKGIIPVGMSAPVPGVKYVFHAEQVTSNGAYSVILEDKLLNTLTDLDQEGYTFTYGAWSQEGPRFALHIDQATVGQEEQSALAEFKLFQNGDRLIIHGDAAMHTSYSILSLDGRLISEGFLQAGMASVIAPKAGLYIVQINGQQASVGRVMIQ